MFGFFKSVEVGTEGSRCSSACLDIEIAAHPAASHLVKGHAFCAKEQTAQTRKTVETENGKQAERGQRDCRDEERKNGRTGAE